MSKKDEVVKPKKSRIKLKHLRMGDIKKNNSIEVDHTIRKIKQREFRHTLICVCIFLVILVFSSSTVVFSVQKINEYNLVESGSLVIAFDDDKEVLDEIVTLDGDDILSDDEALNREGYKFTITNRSKNDVRYVIKLVDDVGMIKFDDCVGMQFKKSDIRYNLNDKVHGDLRNNILLESKIKSGDSKEFEVKVWIDKGVVNARHYHGKIIVEEIK